MEKILDCILYQREELPCVEMRQEQNVTGTSP